MSASESRVDDQDWKALLTERIALFGHRNWIVIADAAYPAQSNPGIETIAANADHMEVVQTALNAIGSCRHVRANLRTDRELDFVDEADAKGVTEFRRRLAGLTEGTAAATLPHEEIIAMLDQAAKLFRILIIKTTLTIPYTTVFLQLDCGYWNEQAEKRLREACARVA